MLCQQPTTPNHLPNTSIATCSPGQRLLSIIFRPELQISLECSVLLAQVIVEDTTLAKNSLLSSTYKKMGLSHGYLDQSLDMVYMWKVAARDALWKHVLH